MAPLPVASAEAAASAKPKFFKILSNFFKSNKRLPDPEAQIQNNSTPNRQSAPTVPASPYQPEFSVLISPTAPGHQNAPITPGPPRYPNLMELAAPVSPATSSHQNVPVGPALPRHPNPPEPATLVSPATSSNANRAPNSAEGAAAPRPPTAGNSGPFVPLGRVVALYPASNAASAGMPPGNAGGSSSGPNYSNSLSDFYIPAPQPLRLTDPPHIGGGRVWWAPEQGANPAHVPDWQRRADELESVRSQLSSSELQERATAAAIAMLGDLYDERGRPRDWEGEDTPDSEENGRSPPSDSDDDSILGKMKRSLDAGIITNLGPTGAALQSSMANVATIAPTKAQISSVGVLPVFGAFVLFAVLAQVFVAKGFGVRRPNPKRNNQ